MHLLVGHYQDPSPARQAEYLECLRRNAHNIGISRITVLIEDDATVTAMRRKDPVFSQRKLRFVPLRRRVLFSDFFAYANDNLRDCLVSIANADIFFDETLALLADMPMTGQMLCLSRWNETPAGPVHFDQPNSQDAWIFEAPVPHIDCDFPLGKLSCDSRLAYEAEKAGLVLSNPSKSVRARHLHSSGACSYSELDRLKGPSRFVPSSFLPTHAPHGWSRPPADEFPSHRGRVLEHAIEEPCRRIEALFERHFGIVAPRSLHRELRRAAVSRAHLPASQDVGLAVIEFREPMGFSLTRLELGSSTHNNSERPLIFIPPQLHGLYFTQVVANHSTPVEIRFRTGGKVFVLAAPGWHGYAPSATFLDDAGWREPVEPLRARDGTVFEVWSLHGTPGERLTIPTQVMLAGQELVRID
jgi:hypothetical protein